MTTDADFKKDVRLFAAINQINYTAALREFHPERKIPLYLCFEPPLPNTEARRWAESRGLKPNSAARECFHQLADPSLDMHACTGIRAEQRWVDHGRHFTVARLPGTARRPLAVMTYSPYRHWTQMAMVDELAAIASQLDLRFRVGYRRDVTYGYNSVPIVFWNPRLIELP